MNKVLAFFILIVLALSIASGEAVSSEYNNNRREKAMNSDSEHVDVRGVSDLGIEIVYDNKSQREELKAAWGFSCVIRGTEKTILFDTGADSSTLLANMDKMGIDPNDIDLVVLSHAHWDHVDGLPGFLERNGKVTVYMLKSFPGNLRKDVQAHGATVVDVVEPLQICENVYSTGEMGTQVEEQSLIIHTVKGSVVITGCAHPGIVQIVEKSKELAKQDLLFVMGGFHLLDKTVGEVESIISRFRELGVFYAAPCHCTGDAAIGLFSEAYRDKFIDIGAGKVISIDDLN